MLHRANLTGTDLTCRPADTDTDSGAAAATSGAKIDERIAVAISTISGTLMTAAVQSRPAYVCR